MKNEKQNHTIEEEKKTMPLGDDMLKDVTGGGLVIDDGKEDDTDHDKEKKPSGGRVAVR